MDNYYVVIKGQKQGPFDIISMIKKIKNGSVTAESQVAIGESEFVKAEDIEDLRTLLGEHGEGGEHVSVSASAGNAPSLGIGRSFSEGLNLWLKYVLSFTVISGLILVVAFSMSKGLANIDFVAKYPTIGNYLVSFVSAFLYAIFFNYILLAKRSQTTQMGSFSKVIASGTPAFLILAALFSIYTIAYGINDLIGLGVLVVLLIVSTFYIFTPFYIFDRELGVGAAMANSRKAVSKSGTDNFGVILTLVAINLIVAVLPAFVAKDLFVFGLFISIPITVSALAFIYDEVAS